MDRQTQTDADRQITYADAYTYNRRYTETDADRQANRRSTNH